MKKILLLIIFILSISVPAFAGSTYYVATDGDNGNSGADCDHAWATFAHAFGEMSGGDTLYLCDGTYTEQLAGMPSGSSGDHTEILAVNDYAVMIDGQSSRTPVGVVSKSYVDIQGIRAKDGLGSSGNHVAVISASDHITIKKSGFWNAGTYQHCMPLTLADATYCLIEDVYVFGRGRYSTYIFQGSYNTYRRVVARWDSGTYSGQPISGICLYNTSYNIVENCIAIDSNVQSTVPDQSGFSIFAHLNAPDNNEYYGNISINNGSSGSGSTVRGWQIDPGSESGMWVDNMIMTNNVSYGNDIGLALTGRGVQSASYPVVINHFTIANTYGPGVIHGSNYAGTIFRDSIVEDSGTYGFQDYGGTAYISYSNFYNNSSGNFSSEECDSNCVTTDPEANGLTYLPRIEDSSALDGAGYSGDIGATIVKRYVDGSLTGDDLWPFPNEDQIRTDMRLVSERGFCADGEDLTHYIWNALGNGDFPGAGADTSPPEVTSTAIATNGTSISVVFNELVNQTLESGDFNLDCTSAGADIALVYSSGTGSTTLVLTSGTTVEAGDSCDIDYVGSGDDVDDAADNPLVAFNNGSVTNNSTADTTAPVISNGLPSGAQACTEDPRSIELTVDTDENATCKYDAADVAYGSMGTTFGTTGGTSHSDTIASLDCEDSYTYYVRCTDGTNANGSSTEISFSISADVPPEAGVQQFSVGGKQLSVGGKLFSVGGE